MDPTGSALLKLCEELHALRDDIYNAEILRGGAAFAPGALVSGSMLVITGDMPLSTVDLTRVPVAQEIYTNKTRSAVAAFVHVAPVAPSVPPGGFILEQTMLLLDENPERVRVPSRAALAHASYGDGITVVIQPNKSLYAAVIASVDVTMIWRVVPLAGRRALGEPRDL